MIHRHGDVARVASDRHVAIWLMYTRRPLYVLAAPIAAWLIWFGVLTAGENWLGWTG